MMRAVVHAAVVVVVAALVGGGACSSEVVGSCVDDGVCPTGTVCAFGLCVDANDARLAAVDIEVEPVESSGLPTQTVFDVDAAENGGARIDVVLKDGVSRDGRVVDVDGAGVAATLQAIPERSIAGRLRVPQATTDRDDGDGSFSLRLLEDADYTLVVTPQDQSFPPLVAPIAGADGPAGAFVVDAVPFVTLSGRVVNSAGVAQDGLEVLVRGNGRRVSTLATTSGDGLFSVLLRAVPVGAELIVRPTTGNTLQPTVVVAIDPVDVDGGERVVDLGDISLGAVSGFSVLANGTVTSSQGPARGATVVFHALVGAGVFTARAVTADDGSFGVPLLPGSYSVGVVPAEGSSVGLLVQPDPVVVEASSAPIVDLFLPPRVGAAVRITTQEGLPAASSSVSFERVGDVQGLAEPVLEDEQPAFLASADADGNAALVVDRGRYRVKITPPRGSGAPAFSTLVTVDDGFARDIVLPPQNVLAGVVVDEGGGRAPGAFVRVFSQLTDEQGRAIFLGEAVCGDDGAFAVSVPDLSP